MMGMRKAEISHISAGALRGSYIHHPIPEGRAGCLHCKVQRKNHEHTDLKDVAWNLVEAAIYAHTS